MLTFSRRAAGELRDRVTARLGRTVREPVARTLHSYAFGVLRMANRRRRACRAAAAAVRRRSRTSSCASCVAERDAVRVAGRAAPGAAHPGLRRRAARPADARGRARPRRARAGRARRRTRAGPTGSRPGAFLTEYQDVTVAGATRRLRPGRADPLRARRAAPRPASCSPPSAHGAGTSSSTSTRTPIRRRPNCSRCSPTAPTSWSSSATRTSRSTPSAAPTSPAIRDVDARFGQRRSGAHGRAAASRAGPARCCSRPRAGSPPGCPAAAEQRRADRRAPRRGRADRVSGRAVPHRQRGGRPTSPACCAVPTSTACRGRGWRCWCARPPLLLGDPAPGADHRRRAGVGARRGPAAGRAAGGGHAARRRCGASLEPARLTEDVAEQLLLGPIGGADVVYLRRLRRVLRRR